MLCPGRHPVHHLPEAPRPLNPPELRPLLNPPKPLLELRPELSHPEERELDQMELEANQSDLRWPEEFSLVSTEDASGQNSP
jgi:hypothetical protein